MRSLPQLLSHLGCNNWLLVVNESQRSAKARGAVFHCDVFNMQASDYDFLPYLSHDMLRKSRVTGGLVQK